MKENNILLSFRTSISVWIFQCNKYLRESSFIFIFSLARIILLGLSRKEYWTMYSKPDTSSVLFILSNWEKHNCSCLWSQILLTVSNFWATLHYHLQTPRTPGLPMLCAAQTDNVGPLQRVETLPSLKSVGVLLLIAVNLRPSPWKSKWSEGLKKDCISQAHFEHFYLKISWSIQCHPLSHMVFHPYF